ncbi:MAG: cadherin domain-containing protein, partial [Cyanobacteria bacterium J06576_12]
IEVKDVAEVDPNPKIVSNGGGSTAHVNVDENSQFVTDVQTVDNRSTEANGRLSYFIHGGEDKSFFSIDKKTGKVSFNFAPDFEKPVDADGDNTYEVGVKVVDGAGYTDTQLLKVKVQDVVEGKPDPDPDPGSPTPNPGETSLVGDDGDNTLRGTDANEMFSGKGGNDVLLGGGGNDRLNGTDKFSRGVGEIDNLNGQAGRDVFFLGDSDGAFYVGEEFGDFAIIQDFVSGEDRFLLSGGSSDYTVADGGNGNAFILTKDGNDAVANVLNQSAADINLDSGDFLYV